MNKRITDSKHRIIELLNIYNITQSEFCKKTGIQKSALSNYLNGDRNPRQDQVGKIADAFGIDPAWLMGYDVPLHRDNSKEKKQNIELDDTEYLIIEHYRASDLGTQNAVLKLLDIEKKDADILDA